ALLLSCPRLSGRAGAAVRRYGGRWARASRVRGLGRRRAVRGAGTRLEFRVLEYRLRHLARALGRVAIRRRELSPSPGAHAARGAGPRRAGSLGRRGAARCLLGALREGKRRFARSPAEALGRDARSDLRWPLGSRLRVLGPGLAGRGAEQRSLHNGFPCPFAEEQVLAGDRLGLVRRADDERWSGVPAGDAAGITRIKEEIRIVSREYNNN